MYDPQRSAGLFLHDAGGGLYNEPLPFPNVTGGALDQVRLSL